MSDLDAILVLPSMNVTTSPEDDVASGGDGNRLVRMVLHLLHAMQSYLFLTQLQLVMSSAGCHGSHLMLFTVFLILYMSVM